MGRPQFEKVVCRSKFFCGIWWLLNSSKGSQKSHISISRLCGVINASFASIEQKSLNDLTMIWWVHEITNHKLHSTDQYESLPGHAAWLIDARFDETIEPKSQFDQHGDHKLHSADQYESIESLPGHAAWLINPSFASSRGKKRLWHLM